jgi:hypothetical protein
MQRVVIVTKKAAAPRHHTGVANQTLAHPVVNAFGIEPVQDRTNQKSVHHRA